jgi:isochorismate synthase
VSVPLPAGLLPAGFHDAAFLRRAGGIVWEKPDRALLLAGFGTAASLRGARGQTVGDAASMVRDMLAGATSTVTTAARPRVFGGGRFSPCARPDDPSWQAFGSWQFTVPAVLVALEPGRLSASLTIRADPGDPGGIPALVEDALESLVCVATANEGDLSPATAAGPEAWQASVAAALKEIGNHRYQKVVLARTFDHRQASRIDQGRVLSSLAGRYRHCYVFAFRSGGAAWLGASPELLASLKDGAVSAASLAGSKPRGATAAEDDALAAELMGSAKERAEHAVVALAITEALAPLCGRLSVPEVPTILRMPNIQHLHTPISGRLLPGHDLLDVVTSLHPTPAVGGWPREEALDAIERLEGMDRGWYAGPIGWLDFDGDGEFVVALRSALVSGSTARLYAGAGIVAGSEPALEYAETETKFRPLRDALGAD